MLIPPKWKVRGDIAQVLMREEEEEEREIAAGTFL